MTGTILVTGGTGKTGGRLITRLSEEGWTARCASRSGVAPAGIESVTFNWFDPSGHEAALDGLTAVYLIAPIGSANPIEQMQPFIERAIAKGVRRFILLSSSLIEEGGPAMGAVHALLRQQAPEWAVLRPSWFMENFTGNPHCSSIRFEDCVYTATDDGTVPFIAVNDIAEVAMRTLTNDTAPNTDLVLTGPEPKSYDEVVDIIGKARGRAVRHIRLSAEALVARLTSFGVPPEFAGMLAHLDRAIAGGAEARTTPIVAQVTASEPVSLESFAARHAAEWKAENQT